MTKTNIKHLFMVLYKCDGGDDVIMIKRTGVVNWWLKCTKFGKKLKASHIGRISGWMI